MIQHYTDSLISSMCICSSTVQQCYSATTQEPNAREAFFVKSFSALWSGVTPARGGVNVLNYVNRPPGPGGFDVTCFPRIHTVTFHATLVFAVLQEVLEVHLGLDLRLLGFLHPSPLHLSPPPPVSPPAPPLSDGGGRVAVVVLSAPPDLAGGRVGNLLRTRDPQPGYSRPRLLRPAPAAPARRADQSLVPQRQHGVERSRSIPGRPGGQLVLPAACGGDVRLRSSPRSSQGSAEVARCASAVHLPPVCASARRLDVTAGVPARVLPQVPLPASGRSSGIPGVERTLSRVVPTQSQPWFASGGTVYYGGASVV